MLPLVTEFSLSLPEFSRFLKLLGGCDTPPSSDAPAYAYAYAYAASVNQTYIL